MGAIVYQESLHSLLPAEWISVDESGHAAITASPAVTILLAITVK